MPLQYFSLVIIVNYLTLTSKNANRAKGVGLTAIVNCDNGQLVSLKAFNEEYMHDGGRASDDPSLIKPVKMGLDEIPSWNNSEIVMFPIVSSSRDHTVMYNGNKFPLDQHGIVRAMIPEIVRSTLQPDTASVHWNYEAGTQVDNSARHDSKPDSPGYVQLPFGFELVKTFIVNDVSVRTTLAIHNTGDTPFSYALGWHPAFTPQGSTKAGLFYYAKDSQIISLETLAQREKGSAIMLPGENEVSYFDAISKRGLTVKGDLGSMMLWSPNPKMFCIEPITEKAEKGTLFDLSVPGTYKNSVQPGEQREFTVEIFPTSFSSIL